MNIIPPSGNEQQFAVAHVGSNEVIIVAPEDYARRYCGRANEDLSVPRFHVIPYTGKPFNGPRHPQSSFLRNDAMFAPRVPKVEIGIEVTPQPTAKDRVKEYLQKTG